MSKNAKDLIVAVLVTLVLFLVGKSILNWAFPPITIGHDLENIYRNKVVKDGT